MDPVTRGGLHLCVGVVIGIWFIFGNLDGSSVSVLKWKVIPVRLILVYQCYIFKQKLQVSSSFKSWKISILCYKYKLLEANQDRKGNRCEIEPCVELQVLLNIWKGTLKCLCTECYDGYHLIGKSHCFLECVSDATRQNQNYRLNNIN